MFNWFRSDEEIEIRNRIKTNIKYIKSFGFKVYRLSKVCKYCKDGIYMCLVEIKSSPRISPVGEKFYSYDYPSYRFCPRCDWMDQYNGKNIYSFIQEKLLTMKGIQIKNKSPIMPVNEIEENISLIEQSIEKKKNQLEKYKEMLNIQKEFNLPYR